MNRRVIASAVVVGALLVAGGWSLFRQSDAPAGAAYAQQGPRAATVIVGRPQLKPFDQTVEALGTVRANESVNITAKVADRVTAIRFEEGQQVRKGDVLIELDSTEARADLAAAEAAERDSRSQYKRSQELYETRALSQAQLEQLEATLLANEARVAAARSRVSDRIITAPFSGRVGLRNVSVGSLVNPGAVITTLDDLSVVKLDFSVPEVFLASLKPGLTVQAHSSAYPGESFEGRVASVDTRVDPTTRSVTIRALIDNQNGRLRPGMFMTVRLVRSEGEALVVPEQAIVPENDRHFVYVVADGRAERREVTLGRRRPGEVEIVAGLTTEDDVIIEGALNVRDGSPVRIRASAGEGAGPT